MQIINNRNANNHLASIRACFKKADEVIIVSPFITADFSFFPFSELLHLKKIRLITRLKPYTADQYGKVEFLSAFFEFAKQHDIELEVSIDNTLHGKIYVAINKGSYFEAIITSANFTTYGLRLNNEWGVSIDDAREIEKLVTNLFDHISYENLAVEQVLEFKKLLADSPLLKAKKEVKINLSKTLKTKLLPPSATPKADFWLKPIGVTGHYVAWEEPFTDTDYWLRFSARPKSVKPGHIVIAYAVGHLRILSIYRVKSGIMHTGKPDDRWPYYVIGENLTPYYGSEWNKHHLTITNQKNEVLANRLFNVTPSGKNTFGKLQRGGDKIRITKEFALYLIDKITKIDSVISAHSE